jgi:hypothetical protein
LERHLLFGKTFVVWKDICCLERHLLFGKTFVVERHLLLVLCCAV